MEPRKLGKIGTFRPHRGEWFSSLRDSLRKETR